MFVAVSTDDTPTSADDWHKYKIDFTHNPPANLGSGAHFPDYPKLGVSDDAILISATTSRSTSARRLRRHRGD